MAEAVGAKEHGAEAVQGRALAFTLYALVFCTGAAALATEIGAARLLAPVLRELDDRVGERHRPRARVARGRLLGRREDRGPEPEPPRAGADRRVRGGTDRDHPVRGRPLPGRLRERARPGLRRCGDRVVLRRARALRACADAARDGRPVRDPARDRRRARRGLGRRASLRAVDRRQPARHLPGRARPHSDDRDEEDPARGCAARRSLRRGAARPAVAPGRSGSRRADRDPGRRRSRGAGADLRARVALPVHPRHRAERRPAALPERGPRGALALAAEHRPHRRRVGHVPRGPAAPRATAAAGRDPRQRRWHDGPCDGRLLPAGADRRGRARPGRDRGRPPLLRARRQPSAARDHGRRAAVPASHPQAGTT